MQLCVHHVFSCTRSGLSTQKQTHVCHLPGLFGVGCEGLKDDNKRQLFNNISVLYVWNKDGKKFQIYTTKAHLSQIRCVKWHSCITESSPECFVKYIEVSIISYNQTWWIASLVQIQMVILGEVNNPSLQTVANSDLASPQESTHCAF